MSSFSPHPLPVPTLCNAVAMPRQQSFLPPASIAPLLFIGEGRYIHTTNRKASLQSATLHLLPFLHFARCLVDSFFQAVALSERFHFHFSFFFFFFIVHFAGVRVRLRPRLRLKSESRAESDCVGGTWRRKQMQGGRRERKRKKGERASPVSTTRTCFLPPPCTRDTQVV
ncbi:hypothetical protein BKA81DRAFT_115899 [Phyllosticta paracitricarpa]